MVVSVASGEVKVLGLWASPFVMRAKIALNFKGVEYEFIDEDFENKNELLLKSNPIYKKVPVLFHDGNPICESSIIVHYIDELWANSGPFILPSDPYDQAIARFWAVYIDDKWFPSMMNILKAEPKEVEPEAIERASAVLLVLEETFEKCSKGKRFFGGDDIGYLDIAFGCFLGWIEAAKELSGIELLDSTKTPCLVSWAESFRSEEAVKEVLGGTNYKLVEVGKKRQPIWKARFAAK